MLKLKKASFYREKQACRLYEMSIWSIGKYVRFFGISQVRPVGEEQGEP